MIMHHIVHCIDCVLFVFAGGCPPSVDVCSDDEFDDTDEELYHLQKCQESKTPLFIPIQPSLSLLLSFTALGQQRFNCYMPR